ncbi:MAG: BTAD domain-containing putative transcriptional regulator [Chloroflexota bacterium]
MKEEQQSTLNLYTFGGVRFEKDGQSLANLDGRKVEALFIYLVANPRPHPRELLADLLWDDRSQKASMSNLRRELSGLRQQVGEYVDISRQAVALQAESGLWFDGLHLSEKLIILESGEPLSDTVQEEIEAALDLYSGDFLAGFSLRQAAGFESWMTTEKVRWQRRVVDGRVKLGAHFAATGQLVQGIKHIRQAISIDPLDEAARQQLMQFLAQSGKRSEALGEFEEMRTLLFEELGVDPSPESQSLFEAISAGEVRVIPRDPIPIHPAAKKVDPKPPQSLPALDTPTPHNLPANLTPFVGRESELARIDDLLAEPQTRLLTIVGVGGMGKTRLGLACTARRLDNHPAPQDGVFFVPLAPVSDPSRIPHAIAEAINLQLVSGSAAAAKGELLDYLRAREMFLFLDNFEHLLEGAELVSDILSSAPQIQILVTTRERLNLRFEQLFSIQGFRIEEWHSLEKAYVNPAVQLFLQTGRRIRHDFQLQEEDLPAMAQICRLVSGMPLGLELAATWVDMLSLEEIMAEIQSGLDFLETDARDVPQRHRSMLAIIEAAWNRLEDNDQIAFAKLAVFRGSFTREAATAVAATNLRQLARLVNASLIQFDADSKRYLVHELLRQFGELKLKESGEEDSTRASQAGYYLGYLNAREADIKGKRQLEAIQEIRREFEGIRSAWEWAAVHKDYAAIDAALDCLMIYLIFTNKYFDGVALQQLALSHLEPAMGDTRKSIVHKLHSRHLVPRQAEIPLLRQALSDAQQNGQSNEIASRKMRLGHALARTGDRKEGFLLLSEAANLAEELSDQYLYCEVLSVYFLNALESDRLHEAERIGKMAFSINRQIENVLGKYELDFRYGRLMLFLGDFNAAEAHFRTYRDFYHRLGRSRIEVIIGNAFLAYTTFLKGNLEEAAQLLHGLSSERFEREARNKYLIRPDMLSLGSNFLNNFKEALQLLKRFEENRRGELFTLDKFNLSWGKSIAHVGLGEYTAARETIAAALHLARDSEGIGIAILALPICAHLYASFEAWERATELLALAYAQLGEWTGWLETWSLFIELRKQLETHGEPKLFSAAWHRGQHLDVWVTVDQLLAELQSRSVSP